MIKYVEDFVTSLCHRDKESIMRYVNMVNEVIKISLVDFFIMKKACFEYFKKQNDISYENKFKVIELIESIRPYLFPDTDFNKKMKKQLAMELRNNFAISNNLSDLNSQVI